jgi:SAM-dependent methyltransferase
VTGNNLDAGDAGTGGYDVLYRAAGGVLWPDEPGRLMSRALGLIRPGRALDIGCGDARNLLWLEQRGWTVDGCDVSEAALHAARDRLAHAGHRPRGRIWRDDWVTAELPTTTYDMVLACGVYCCLDHEEMLIAHAKALSCLRSGGLLMFAAFDDRLPLPANHATGPLHLRPASQLLALLTPLNLLYWELGTIDDEHRPLVGPHRHAVAWGLAQKP